MCVCVCVPRWGETAAYRKDAERRESNDFYVSWLDPNSDFCDGEPAVRADGFLYQKIPEEFIFRVSLSCLPFPEIVVT